MFEPGHIEAIQGAIERQTHADRKMLDELREDVRTSLRPSLVVRPHSATAVSFAASEGANNHLVFDPFRMELVRIVDSQGRQLYLDVISPRTDPDELERRHQQAEDSLSVLMADLGVEHLSDLSDMIPTGIEVREKPDEISSSWTSVYRDLVEWAVLYDRIKSSDWSSDTLIVRNGLLRSKIFRHGLFIEMGRLLREAIERHRRNGTRIFLAGIARRSQVLARYRLAMALEDALPAKAARYVAVPRELEVKVYKWKEFARGAEEDQPGEAPKFVLGSMFLVRFGQDTHDPVWAIDLLESQVRQAGEIFGYLLQDAIGGFPVPFYPSCLQRAHEYAQAVDFDLDVLQDTIIGCTRQLIEQGKRGVFDGLTLAADIANRPHA